MTSTPCMLIHVTEAVSCYTAKEIVAEWPSGRQRALSNIHHKTENTRSINLSDSSHSACDLTEGIMHLGAGDSESLRAS